MSLELNIIDPRNGTAAYVNPEHQVNTSAITRSLEHYTNSTKGESFAVILEQTPTGASDYFFYFKNNEDRNIVVEGMTIRVGSAESFEIYSNVSGTTSGGTTLTPAALNLGSSKSIDGTIEAGNNITGISGGTLIDRIYWTSTESSNYNFDQDIIIPKGNNFAFLAITGGIQTSITLNCFIDQEV